MKNYKKDFPIFRQKYKGRPLVYLDSAATSQKPQVVIDAVREFYETYNSNIHRGLYPIAERATEKVEEVRKKVAKFISAKHAEEIIFTNSATEAINLVMYSWGMEQVTNGDTVAVTVMDHHSNFVPWQQLAKKKKASFEIVDITQDGYLTIEKTAYQLPKNTKLFAFPYISNMLGTVNDVNKIVKKIRQKNPSVKILVDAAQAAPNKKMNVQEMGCDFLVFSGHKMFAETGIGILYAKKEILERMHPFLYGGDMIREVTIDKTTFADIPSKFEAGTINISGIMSLGAAIDYLEEVGMDTILKHERKLASYCTNELKKINGITIFGKPQSIATRSGVISFAVDRIHPHDLAQVLGDMNICIRAGHHCAMPLHKRLGVPATARVSLHIYNNQEDIDALIRGVKKAEKLFSL